MFRLKFAVIAFVGFLLCACSGSKQLATSQGQTTAETEENSAVRSRNPHFPVKMDSVELLRLEIAHGSFLRALELMAHGDNQLAEQFMQHAYAADPENRFLAFSVLELMVARGASAEAASLAEKAKNLKGQQTSSQYALLGRIYGEQSNLDSALAYYKKAVDASDQNLHAAYEYSLLLEISQNREELSRVYALLLPQTGYPQSLLERQALLLTELKKDSALADLFGDVYEARGERSFLERRIRLLLKMKRYEEAVSAVEELRADSAVADDSLSIVFLVAAHWGMKQGDVAIDSLKEIYKRHPNRGDVLLSLALFETRQNQKEQSIIHFERLSQMENYEAVSFAMLSAYAWEDGDSARSLDYLEKAYAKSPELSYRNQLLQRYRATENFPKAYALLDSSLARNSRLDSLRAKWIEKGNLEELRRFDENVELDIANLHYIYATMLQLHAEVLERVPTDSARRDSAQILRQKAAEHYLTTEKVGGELQQFLFAVGSNLLGLGQVDSAIVVFKKLFHNFPMDASAKNHLGYTLVDLNRNPEELRWGGELIDEALRLDSGNVAYMDSKAWALYRVGKFQEALALMERVEEQESSWREMFYSDTSIFAHLAAICQALSLNERALNYYRKILEIDPKNENARKQIEILDKKKE
ncbi:hypothetical protein [uncultured Fibrobacter sp.]|uniref:tetratricopeptide repeat protein n=1 Tax=uncultured Fibrobacter sp. TaxID=261512 RepID=UPI0025978CEA|nr:hypothetical protein [uncultured Fibrobacter sp.]